MNPEILKSTEGQMSRADLVSFLQSRKEEMDQIVYAPNDKRQEIMESSEAKRILHNWIVNRSKLFDRIEVTNELGDICKEAGLHEEALRQYANASELAATETIIDEKTK